MARIVRDGATAPLHHGTLEQHAPFIPAQRLRRCRWRSGLLAASRRMAASARRARSGRAVMVRDGARAPPHHEAVQQHAPLILRGRETIDPLIPAQRLRRCRWRSGLLAASRRMAASARRARSGRAVMVRDGARAPPHHEAVQQHAPLILRGRETIDPLIPAQRLRRYRWRSGVFAASRRMAASARRARSGRAVMVRDGAKSASSP